MFQPPRKTLVSWEMLGISSQIWFETQSWNHQPGHHWLPSGELTFCHGKSPFLMGKSTISMAIFNCYVSSPEGNHYIPISLWYPHVRRLSRPHEIDRRWLPAVLTKPHGGKVAPTQLRQYVVPAVVNLAHVHGVVSTFASEVWSQAKMAAPVYVWPWFKWFQWVDLGAQRVWCLLTSAFGMFGHVFFLACVFFTNYHLVISHSHGKSPCLSSVNRLFRLGPSKYHGELLVITRGYIPWISHWITIKSHYPLVN